mgnify:CR=1 FL=1
MKPIVTIILTYEPEVDPLDCTLSDINSDVLENFTIPTKLKNESKNHIAEVKNRNHI